MDTSQMPVFSGIRAGEAPEIINILRQCDLPIEDITTEMLKNFLVARKSAVILGVVGLDIHGHDALLRSLAVVEDSRGKGIGSLLVASAERYARSRNVQSLYLLTLTAKALFRKVGYAVIDRRTVPAKMQATREFESLCPATAVCMKKEITL